MKEVNPRRKFIRQGLWLVGCIGFAGGFPIKRGFYEKSITAFFPSKITGIKLNDRNDPHYLTRAQWLLEKYKAEGKLLAYKKTERFFAGSELEIEWRYLFTSHHWYQSYRAEVAHLGIFDHRHLESQGVIFSSNERYA